MGYWFERKLSADKGLEVRLLKGAPGGMKMDAESTRSDARDRLQCQIRGLSSERGGKTDSETR